RLPQSPPNDPAAVAHIGKIHGHGAADEPARQVGSTVRRRGERNRSELRPPSLRPADVVTSFVTPDTRPNQSADMISTSRLADRLQRGPFWLSCSARDTCWRVCLRWWRW